MVGPMLVAGFTNAECSLLKRADPKNAFTRCTFTQMTLSFLLWEMNDFFVPCVFGTKLPRLGVFERLLLENAKWALAFVGLGSIFTYLWESSPWPLTKLLELFTF
jgi:hypothetical protein